MKTIVLILCFFQFSTLLFSQSIIKVNNNNKLYFWVENSIIISTKTNPKNLIVLANSDTLVFLSNSFKYNLIDCDIKSVKIRVGIMRNKKKVNWLDSANYNVEYLIHPPLASSFWAENDSISQERIDTKMTLQLKCGVSELCNSVCPYAKICAFNFKVLRNDSLLYQKEHYDRKGLFYDDDYFVNETNDTIMENIGMSRSISWKALNFLIRNSKKGDIILFENVKAIFCRENEIEVNTVRLIIK
ncbi:MAG: hypothetical protein Q8K70_07895 [Bacteroidota bacterium]|nr:hypothetical protein [Bacteroidota bacterium]